MTTSAEHTTRQKLPICPEWCAGHTDTYQGWERIEGGGVARSHASDASDYPMMRATWTDAFGNGTGLDDEVGVELVRVETPDEELGPVGVEIIAGGHAVGLTPAQAVAYARTILAAAERATDA